MHLMAISVFRFDRQESARPDMQRDAMERDAGLL